MTYWEGLRPPFFLSILLCSGEIVYSKAAPLRRGFFLRDTRAAHRARRELARPQGNQGRKQGRKASKVASSTPDPSSRPDPKI